MEIREHGASARLRSLLLGIHQELKELDSVELEVGGKTKAQRLRNALFILHRELNLQMKFDDFYAQKMESIIQHFKDQIPE